MADERHKTSIEIDVDDQQIRQLGAAIKGALGSEVVNRFEQSMRGVTQQVEKLAKAFEGVDVPKRRGEERARLPSVRKSAAIAAAVSGVVGAPGSGLSAAQRRQREREEKERGGRGLGFWGTTAAVATGNMLTRGATAAAGGEGLTERGLGAVPFGIGAPLAAAVGTARQVNREFIAFRQSQAEAFGQLGGRVGPGRGAALGIAPGAISGQLAGLARGAGVRGEGAADIGIEMLLRQRLMGIGGGEQASLVGAAGIGGQAQNPAQARGLINEAIGGAVVAGFRDARIGEFVQSIAGHVEALRRQGIMVDPKSTIRAVAAVGATRGRSLQGEAGMSAVRGMEEVIRGAPSAQGFLPAMLMQQAMGGGRDPFRAFMAMEEDPAAMIPQMVQQISGMGGSVEAKAFALHQGMGGRISRRQALELIEAGERGDLSADRVDKIMTEGTAKQRELAEGGKAAVGTAATEAGMQAQRIRKGGEVQRDILAMRKAELEIVKQAAAIGAKVAKETVEAARELIDAFKKGGFTELMGKAGEMMREALKGLTEKLETMLTKAFPDVQETAGFKVGAELNRLVEKLDKMFPNTEIGAGDMGRMMAMGPFGVIELLARLIGDKLIQAGMGAPQGLPATNQ